eukprot:2896702-Rhodomonas_salina.1
MVLAKVSISDQRKTLQFVMGIKDMSYRRFILEKAPKTLNNCYAAVLTLRQAEMSSGYGCARGGIFAFPPRVAASAAHSNLLILTK